MKIQVLVILFMASLHLGNAQNINDFFNEADGFFKSYVRDGKVNYEAIAENPKTINTLLSQAEGIKAQPEDSNTYQAFWVNAYNLAVIKGIIDHYPVASPLDTEGFFDTITYRIAGESLTLNTIENIKLRAVFHEPRLHFVLVCGAIGCPPLIAKAYTPDNLELQLETQTKMALNNPDFIKVTGDAVQLSEIFKWYKGDFVKDGSLLDFINPFRSKNLNPELKISYYPYNWKLNKQ